VTRRNLGAGAFASCLLFGVGCSGGETPDFGAPGVTEMTLTSTPDTPVTGVPATLSVTAQNSLTKIKTVDVDFENDGTWDAEATFDALSVSASFIHTYDTAGSVIVRAEVEDANGAITSKTLLLIVETPPAPAGGASSKPQ